MDDREQKQIDYKEKRRIRRKNRRLAMKRKMSTMLHSKKIKKVNKRKEEDDWVDEIRDYYGYTDDFDEDKS